MRKLWTIAATLLLAGGVALGQSSGSTAAPSPTPGAQTTIIRGCLHGTGGSYTLSSSGTSYQLSGDTADLAANVDKTVEITGTNVSDQTSAATQPNQQNFTVQSVSAISDKCESNVGQTPDTQGMTSAQTTSGAASTGSSTQPGNPSTLNNATPAPSGQPAPENNNTTATPPPQNQSSLGAGTAGSTGTSSDMNSQSAAATTDQTTQQNATSPSAAPSNSATMNSPATSEANAQSANPSGETNATSTGAAADQSASPAPSAGTSASEQAPGTETAQATTGKKKGGLPQTASPLPLLGLLGFGSLTGGLFARLRRK